MSVERARLFVALELPEEVRVALAEWRGSVLDPGSPLRLVPVEALHVTLCFLGWRTVEEIDPIGVACEAVAAASPASVELGDPVWLPRRRPSVLAVELRDPGGSIARVQEIVSRALQQGGWYAPESRPFFAHVTVARVRKGARAPRGTLAAPEAVACTCSSVSLYRSRLGGAGARYERQRTFELGSASAPRDPVSVVKRFHEEQARAYAGGDLEPLRDLLSEDVVWHVPGRSAIAGSHSGIDAVLAYFDLRRRLTDHSFRVTVHGIALIGERVVQLATGRAIRDGRELEWETAGVFRVQEGRIAECWLLPFHQYLFDEIWR